MQSLNLSGKIYEIDQNSKLYENYKTRREEQLEFIKRVRAEYQDLTSDFAFFDGKTFGIVVGSELEEKYGKELVLKEKNGFRQFKKTSPMYKKIVAIGKEVFVYEFNPFALIDEFGPNNSYGNQWIGERWFYAVKRPEEVQGIGSTEIAATEYMKVFQKVLEEDEAK